MQAAKTNGMGNAGLESAIQQLRQMSPDTQGLVLSLIGRLAVRRMALFRGQARPVSRRGAPGEYYKQVFTPATEQTWDACPVMRINIRYRLPFP